MDEHTKQTLLNLKCGNGEMENHFYELTLMVWSQKKAPSFPDERPLWSDPVTTPLKSIQEAGTKPGRPTKFGRRVDFLETFYNSTPGRPFSQDIQVTWIICSRSEEARSPNSA